MAFEDITISYHYCYSLFVIAYNVSNLLFHTTTGRRKTRSSPRDTEERNLIANVKQENCTNSSNGLQRNICSENVDWIVAAVEYGCKLNPKYNLQAEWSNCTRNEIVLRVMQSIRNCTSVKSDMDNLQSFIRSWMLNVLDTADLVVMISQNLLQYKSLLQLFPHYSTKACINLSVLTAVQNLASTCLFSLQYKSLHQSVCSHCITEACSNFQKLTVVRNLAATACSVSPSCRR